MGMKKNNLQNAIRQAYLNLRESLLETEQHPDEEFYELSEMHANEVYDDALEALILARLEEKNQGELSGEPPL